MTITGTKPAMEEEVTPPHRRLSGITRVWTFNVAVAAGALLFFAIAVRHLPALQAPHRIPWWIFAVLFCLAEIAVVHIEFRRDAHSFSLSEVALVIGLFFVSPAGLVLAQLVGAGIALAVHRRQSILKLVFNLANFFLQASVAIGLFHLFIGPTTTIGPRAWSAALVATSASSLVSVLTIFIAISLSQGTPELGHLPRAVSFGLIVTLTNTSLGLVGATIIWVNFAAIMLLLIPTATLFIAYRAYAIEREKHDSLEFLYESTRTLNQSPEEDPDLSTLLTQARKMFKAEYAEIRIFPTNESSKIVRATLGPRDNAFTEETLDPIAVPALLGQEDQARLISHPLGNAAPPVSIPNLCVKDAMVSPLRGETRIIGSLIVLNRLGDVSTFDRDDLQLFETLASHISVTLEKGRLERSLAQVTQLKEHLKYQAFHDPLTGLANRLLFADRVEHSLARGGHPPAPVSVLFLDLDDFKRVNDSLGHAAGDELLQAVASRILHALRPGDTAARLGGDEFAALLENTRPNEAVTVVKRILHALEAPFHLAGREVNTHASVGIASGRPGDMGSEEILRNADVAMYVAKRQGKSRYVTFEESMHTIVVERMELEDDLRTALRRDQLEVFYQPLMRLETNEMVGVEALVRWNHPKRGMVPPAEFIPLAEESNLINEIEAWVLQRACRQVRSWHHPFGPPMALNVNISARHIHESSLVETVREILAETDFPADLLQLEITETVMMQDTEAVLTTLRALKSLGVKIAIDDFGTGYSSLSYLKRFPVDMLKIDRSFLDGLSKGPEEAALAKAVIHIGRALSLLTVAEGIETERQLERLRELGCDIGQGHLIGHPMDARGFEAWWSMRVSA